MQLKAKDNRDDPLITCMSMICNAKYFCVCIHLQ